ncbi:MAG: hypothetical protein QXG54_05180 [Desulfurococcaceae archaeon]
MAIVEVLDPDFIRTIAETSLMYLSNLSRLSFDESYRMFVRVGWIDDGHVRIRDAQDTSISIVEILRHMTWTSLSLAQLGATTAQPGESPPPSVIAVGGFDGGAVRMLRTDFYGKLELSDASLSTLSKLLRWGRDVSPTWVHGGEVTAPSAGSTLVDKIVGIGRSGYIYGFYIMASEPNHFRINWTSGNASRSLRIVFPGPGSLQYTDIIPLNEGSPADAGTTVSITVLNPGSSGSVYQARLLYAEV